MKKPNRLFTTFAFLIALALSRVHLAAQPQGGGGAGPGGGPGMMNFDPQQMQQMMMQFFRDRLEVTNDVEWKVVEDRLSKVMQLRMETMFGGAGMGFGAMRGNRGGNGPVGGAPPRIPGMPQPSPEAEALRNAIESNAPMADVKAKLDRYRESRKKKAAELAKAQDSLREVLSVRQEATLVMMGTLD